MKIIVKKGRYTDAMLQNFQDAINHLTQLRVNVNRVALKWNNNKKSTMFLRNVTGHLAVVQILNWTHKEVTPTAAVSQPMIMSK